MAFTRQHLEYRVALRKESVDRNCKSAAMSFENVMSLSARRAWIEIWPVAILLISVKVALRKESVDRNLYYGDDLTFSDVALRKESVDRNIRMTLIFLFSPVALRKESVDRNSV